MAKSKSKHDNQPAKRSANTSMTMPEQQPVEAPQRPGGKLGVIIDRLTASGGATADELAEAMGWQKHTVQGALSRLRARGFAMQLEDEGGRKAYRLGRSED